MTLDNVKLFIGHDPGAPYDKAVDALTFERARNLKLRDVEVIWEEPAYDRWRSALRLEDVSGLELRGFSGRPARPGVAAAVILDGVEEALITGSRAASGTDVFLDVRGAGSRGIVFSGNDVRNAAVPVRTAPEVAPRAVISRNNLVGNDR